MLTSSIGWILVVSGLITAGAGLAAFLFPHFQLQSTFGIKNPDDAAVFFVRHWGVLVLVVGGLLVFSAFEPAIRVPILVAAVVEKFALGLLVLFGPLKRTSGMTASAIVDSVFSIIYVIYIGGLWVL